MVFCLVVQIGIGVDEVGQFVGDVWCLKEIVNFQVNVIYLVFYLIKDLCIFQMYQCQFVVVFEYFYFENVDYFEGFQLWYDIGWCYCVLWGDQCDFVVGKNLQ